MEICLFLAYDIERVVSFRDMLQLFLLASDVVALVGWFYSACACSKCVVACHGRFGDVCTVEIPV